MPVYNTPITADDSGLKKVLSEKQPVLLVLHDGKQRDKPLHDALKTAAKKNAGELLVVRVDTSENPKTLSQYDSPQLPALITLQPGFLGRKEKSRAEQIRPADLRAHVEHLLNDKPLPEKKAAKKTDNKKKDNKKGAVHVSDTSFQREVLKSNKPVLVDFWAPWCGPCKTIAPFIEKMAGEYAGQVKIAKLNTDQNPKIARKFGIQSIPTMILFDNGKPVERLTGANPNAIKNLLQDVAHK